MLFEIFILLFNTFIFLPYILKLKIINTLDINLIRIFLSGLAIHYLLFFILLNIKKIGKYIATGLFGFSYSLYSLSLFVYGYKMNKIIIASALENELGLSYEFINTKLIILSLLFIIILFFTIKSIKFNKKFCKIFCTISLLIILYNGYRLAKYNEKIYLTSYPIIDVFELLKFKKVLVGLEYAQKYENKNLDKIFKTTKNIDNINVVIIVGESARYDFFKNYTPNIQKENIVLFKALSNSLFTREAVPEILTFKKDNLNYSIVDIMNAFGFKTHWIGSQNIYGSNDASYAYFTLNSNIQIFKDRNRKINYDFELLKYLDANLYNNGKNFYIIHQIGSHFPFNKRFEKQYTILKDYCDSSDITSCSKEELKNAYINTIHYTDLFLNEIIKRFKDKTTLLFYVSDHGLGYTVINKNESPLVVPAFLWKNNFDINIVEKENMKHGDITKMILEYLGIIQVENSNNKNF